MRRLARAIGRLLVGLAEEEAKARIRILEEELEAERIQHRLSQLEVETLTKINQRNEDRIKREIQDLGGMPMKAANDVSALT